MPINIPENAARNADGSLQNPAAWGLTPQGNPMGASSAGGGFFQGQLPQVNFDAIDWNDPVLSGGDARVGQQARQAFQNGQITSNLQTYLNERNTARNLGLIGANDEFNRGAVFGGNQAGATGNFFGQSVAQGPQVGNTALGNIGTVMGALGANSQSHMPRMDGGIPGIRQFGIPGTSNGIGGQAGLGAVGLQNYFNNYDLNSAIQLARGDIRSNTGNFGPNPATNPFGGGLQTNFQGDRQGLNTAFNPYGPARPQQTPGAPSAGGVGVPSAPGAGVGNMPSGGLGSQSPFAPGTGPGSARALGNITRTGFDRFGNPLPAQDPPMSPALNGQGPAPVPQTPVDPFPGSRGTGGVGPSFIPGGRSGNPMDQLAFDGSGFNINNIVNLLNMLQGGGLGSQLQSALMPRRQPGRGFSMRRPMNYLWGF